MAWEDSSVAFVSLLVSIFLSILVCPLTFFFLLSLSNRPAGQMRRLTRAPRSFPSHLVFFCSSEMTLSFIPSRPYLTGRRSLSPCKPLSLMPLSISLCQQLLRVPVEQADGDAAGGATSAGHKPTERAPQRQQHDKRAIACHRESFL